MSFASEVKKELTTIDADSCCQQAELSALIVMNGEVSSANETTVLNIQTENAAIARRIFKLIKEIYSFPVELLVRKKMKLKKNNVYIIRMIKNVPAFLNELGIHEHPNGLRFAMNELEECCRQAYLRGSFLASGSINNPETSSYHLEIFNFSKEHNDALCELLNSFQLKARVLKRRNGYITYVKEAEKITEFLIIIGAHNALFKFEDVRIVRDLRNSVNRLVNCETANLNKTISAAFRQVENIKLIDETIGLHSLPDRLKEIAELRLNHQDASLKELSELVKGQKISKSGVNHRLKKLEEIANKIRRGEKVI